MRIGQVAVIGCLALMMTDGAAVAQQAAPQALREAAGDHLLVGAAVMSRQLDDPKLSPLIARQFNCLTGENEFKPSLVHPEPDKFTFDAADRVVDFARRHDMKVVGHTLVWHSQSPAWLFDDANGQPLPREQALANLKAHIDAVAGHFRGKVVGWDVVNEAISDKPGEYLRDTPARRAIGDDYVVRAFEFARAADPDAQLYYNDYNNEIPGKRDKTLRLIRELNAAGCRVDAVGLQCHLKIDSAATSPRLLNEAIAAYARENVKVMITELDIDVLVRRQSGADVTAGEQAAPDPYKQSLPPDVARAQADFYRDIFAVVRRHPDVVTRVTFWGTHDGASWLNNWPAKGRTNHPLLWDRDLRPKPAFDAVLETLANKQAVRH